MQKTNYREMQISSMKNTTAKFATIVGAAIVLSATQLGAITVTVNRITGYYYGNAGEFTLTPSADLVWGGYGAKTHNQLAPNPPNDFQTFCLESQEEISDRSATYLAYLNDKAIWGGVGPQGDPISVGTAWLYYLFATENPVLGYNYSPGSARITSARALQAAIWYLEGESGGFLTSAIQTLLINQFGSIANAKLDNAGRYPVKVLNLYLETQCGQKRRQDMLVLCAVPDGGLTLMMLGIGIASLAVVSRKLRK